MPNKSKGFAPRRECECGVPHMRQDKGMIKPRATCKAHNRDGSPCGTWPSDGLLVCRKHGAGTRQAKQKSAKYKQEVKAQRMAARFADAVEVNPVEALLGLIYHSAGHVKFYLEQVNSLVGEDSEKLVWGDTKLMDKTGGEDWGTTSVEEAGINMWLKLYNDERDRLASYIEKAVKLGIDERRVRLAEDQGKAIGDVLKLILRDFLGKLIEEFFYNADEELKEAWMEWAREIVPTRLREVSALTS